MPGPLEGLNVVDCSWGTAGPRISWMLADYGADVVAVERPGGDPLRRLEPHTFAVLGRGKRSLELDLKSTFGKGSVLDLLAGADVMIQGWKPGAAERLGLDYASLHSSFPSLVVCSVTGFGPTGPLREVPGYEALVHALVGTMAEQAGHREGPIYEGLPFASIGAAYMGAIGTLAALYRRHDDGVGRLVETSLLDGALAYLSMLWGSSDLTAGGMPKPGAHRLISRSYLCADGRYIGIHTGAVGAFGRLMVELGLDDRIPPSDTGLDMGVRLTDEQKHILETETHDIFASRTQAEWVEILRRADVCAIEHMPACEVFDSPQARHNAMVVEVDDPVLGRVEQVAPPIKLSATTSAIQRPAPLAGSSLPRWSGPSLWAPETVRTADTRPLLDGLRVLDLGAYYAGPYTSRLLADLGADVIKLEPVPGDPLRGMERPFFSAQAGKRSIAANLKDPELAEAVVGLLEWADVVHHNMRPGAAERLGLGYDQATKVKPDLLYLYAPGWGSSGPDKDRQSFAPLLSGYVGIGLECAGQYNDPLFPTGNEDPGNGLLGAVAVLMALLHRQRTGVGQYIENPQLNATMAHMAHAVRTADGTVLGADRLDPLQMGINPLDRLYQTADGWVCVVAALPEERNALGRVLGVDTGTDDPYQLESEIAEAVGRLKTDELLDELRAAGVPAAVPTGPNMTTLLHDPYYRDTHRVAEALHPEKGTVVEIDQLVSVSDAGRVEHRLAPRLGQHSTEVLLMLGYTQERIESLLQSGSIKTGV